MLAHGLGLSLNSWRSVIDVLASRHRVIAYDLRGHGRSGPAHHAGYRKDAHAADLDAVLARITGGRPAMLVGHSLGGAVILARARHSADGIAGAVFAGSAAAVVTVRACLTGGSPARHSTGCPG